MNPLRVFIVDDNSVFAASLALLIKGRGYEVELASSGEEAIEKLHQQDFDITFMDVKLPGKDGVESLLEIHRFKPSARIVMMTGYSVEQFLEQIVNHGAWRVLSKPLNLQQALDMLEDIKPDGILIVDDDRDFIASIEDSLISNGHKVFVARNGPEAIERIRSPQSCPEHAHGVDILILDMRLPILNGLETYLELKRTHHALPTLIVTAHTDEKASAADKLQSWSVSGILRKPFAPRELLKVVEHLSHAEKE